MLETLIAKIGLPVLVHLVGEALGAVDTPVTKGAAAALRQVQDAINTGGITAEQMSEAHRHAEEMARLSIEENKANVGEVNQSLRAEIASEDKYVRRMRPTFGYLMAITWAAQMLGLAYVIVFETGKAGSVLAAMSNLSAIWAVGLSVLGIYVYKRSEEKKGTGGREMIFWNGP
ncbi:MAG: holin family protein [Alphaproteobacteria bacterium]|nr:holin family protein [Alphaproteobacteria bacterium]